MSDQAKEVDKTKPPGGLGLSSIHGQDPVYTMPWVSDFWSRLYCQCGRLLEHKIPDPKIKDLVRRFVRQRFELTTTAAFV